MPYAFTRSDRSTAAAVRRIAAEQLDGALADLGRADAAQPGTIHGLRKRIKKLRGLLRLVEPRFDGFRAENAALRDAGRHIAGLRDAAVRAATFARLCPDPSALGPEAHAAFAAALDAERRAAAGADAAAPLAALHLALAAVRSRLPDWRLEGKGFDLLADGLSRTWARAQAAQAMAEAERAGAFAAEPFHDWRKRVKAHWYHARLLAPIWPQMMAPHVAAADDLGEELGIHNDIAVLADHLAAHPVAADHPAAMAALHAIARAERARIADAQIAAGRRLFADRPRAIARRWGAWWAVWHAG